MRGRPWTPFEDDTITAKRRPDAVLAVELGRTISGIRQRCKALRRAERASATPPVEPGSILPSGWYGPPGSGYGPGDVWVPGAAFRRSA